MGVFEAGFQPEMELEDAKKLVRDAIAAGVFNDLGSGSNIDLTVITKDKTTELRPYEVANVRGPRFNDYKYAKGTTGTAHTTRQPPSGYLGCSPSRTLERGSFRRTALPLSGYPSLHPVPEPPLSSLPLTQFGPALYSCYFHDDQTHHHLRSRDGRRHGH